MLKRITSSRINKRVIGYSVSIRRSVLFVDWIFSSTCFMPSLRGSCISSAIYGLEYQLVGIIPYLQLPSVTSYIKWKSNGCRIKRSANPLTLCSGYEVLNRFTFHFQNRWHKSNLLNFIAKNSQLSKRLRLHRAGETSSRLVSSRPAGVTGKKKSITFNIYYVTYASICIYVCMYTA